MAARLRSILTPAVRKIIPANPAAELQTAGIVSLAQPALNRTHTQLWPSASSLFSPHSRFSTASEASPEEATPRKPTGLVSDEAAPRSRDRADEPYVPEEWVYNLTEIPPDLTACRLSDASKEKMYALHKQDPDKWSAANLAKEYRIREQRAHAILWLKEIEKQMEEELGEPLDDSFQQEVDARLGTVDKAVGERHVKIYPSEEVDEIENKNERFEKLLEESDKEEKYLVDEFVQRLEFNMLQMYGLVKVNPMDRKRPDEGWSYVVEELGEAGKRGRGGGRRYVVGPDGTKRGLNELEKVFLEREKPKPRRKLIR